MFYIGFAFWVSGMVYEPGQFEGIGGPEPETLNGTLAPHRGFTENPSTSKPKSSHYRALRVP